MSIVKNSLTRFLQSKIKMNGPISFTDYMQISLTFPQYGYYSKVKNIGFKGDFITSPQVSNLFGEMIANWIVNECQAQNIKRSINLTELGPGTGKLMKTVLRTIEKFNKVDISKVNLLDFSSSLKNVQSYELKDDIKVNLIEDLSSIETNNPNFIIANEFLDCFPVQLFFKEESCWKEILVDLNEDESEFRFVKSKHRTKNEFFYKSFFEENHRRFIEFCPAAGIIVQKVADIIEKSKEGGALFIDYGHCGEKEETIRAYKNHEQVHVLSDPGNIDITADVDFSFLINSIRNHNPNVQVLGPVSQAYFLVNMGMLLRMKNIMDKMTNEKDKKLLMDEGDMLVSSSKMGKIFKFLGILPTREKKSAGFNPPETGPPGL